MGAQDRLYGWDLDTISLYPNAPTFDATSANAYLNYVTAFQQCRLLITDRDMEGRATSEDWDFPLPIASGWTLRMGSVVDKTLPTLMELRLLYGRGPFIVWMHNRDNFQAVGRVLLNEVEWVVPENAQTQSVTLKGQGPIAFDYRL